jgi:organic radical activating enzyme
MNFQNIPFTDIVKFGQINMLERPLFSTSWILGRFCNYKCSYCWPHARSDAIDFFSLENYQKTVDQIKQQARNNGFIEFHWGFSGGEPTAYKDLLSLIKYLDDGVQTPYQSVHMTTNLSPGKKWWANWLSATETMQRKGLTASYHAEFANEAEFIDKCLFLIDHGVLLTVNQVMVPEHFWEYYERAKRLADNGINVTIKPQSDPTASFVVKTYTPEMINILQTEFPQQVNGEMSHQVKLYDSKNTEYLFDQAERLNAFGFNKFRGWTCNAGYQSIIIRGDEIKRAYSCYDYPLGSISEGFNLFNAPKRCVTSSCVSSADSKVPKCK